MKKNFLQKSISLGLLAAVLGIGIISITAPMQAEAKVDFEDMFDFEPHRGGRDARPENTLYAYVYAMEQGATSIECDMQMTVDGDIVMSHNPILNPEITVDKYGNRIEPGKYDIRKLTVVEIKQFNVADMDKSTEYYQLHGRTQVNPKFAQIPTLEEVFRLVQESGNTDVKLNLEAKSYPARLYTKYQLKSDYHLDQDHIEAASEKVSQGADASH